MVYQQLGRRLAAAGHPMATAMACTLVLPSLTCFSDFSPSRCGQTYGRHSNSIDVTKKVCGECKGRLLFLGKFQQDGTPAKSRAPSAYSRFVAEHFQAAKEGCPPGASQADVMKVLAERWAAQQKQAKG